MEDRLVNGQKVRCLNVLDDANRQASHNEVERSLPGSRETRVLNHLLGKHGKPERISMDNGPEFISNVLAVWSQGKGIKLLHIQPGKPTQNAFIERFNKNFRQGVLDAMFFENMEQARTKANEWMWDYNHLRPHQSLGSRSPINYAKEVLSNKPKVTRLPRTPSLLTTSSM